MFFWSRRQHELDEEIRAHLAMALRDGCERGEDPETARLRARYELGNIGLIKEVTRDMWSWMWLERLVHDLRYGLRVLGRSPGFTVIALLSLALGIGVNTAIFSVVNAVMLKTLPVHDPARLVIIGEATRIGSVSSGTGIRTDIFSYPFYKQLHERNQTFTDIYASGRCEYLKIAVAGDEKSTAQAGKVEGRFVTGNYFNVLGVAPALGRAFTQEETRHPGGAPVAVISYGYWERQFGRDASMLGRKLSINGSVFTVIGIMPRVFTGDIVGAPIDIWFPVTMKAQANPGYDYLNDSHTNWLLLMGRLKPGVTLAQADAATNVLSKQIYTDMYAANTPADQFRSLARERFPVSSGSRGFSRMRQNFSAPLLVLMGVVAFVLLICCGNVANLQLARAEARTREMSLRLAIGAGRGRLVRQLLTESLLLAIAGGILGLLFSFWAAQLLVHLVSGTDRSPLDLQIDVRILIFTGATALLAGVLFGLAPAWQSAHMDLVSRLRETRAGQSSGGMGRTLVALQVALSMILLVGAGLFVRTLQNLRNADVGYAREGLVLAELDFKAAGYQGSRITQLAHRLLDGVAATPGVKGVTISENGLFSGTDSLSDDDIEGYTPRTDADRNNHSDRVGPNYFQIVGTPILAGRGITTQDMDSSAKVAVINESMARFCFPKRNPIGRHILDREGKPVAYTIVGVVQDVKQSELREPAPRRFYLSYFQPKDTNGLDAMNLEIRTVGESASALAAIRRQITAVDPKLPILDLSAADKLIDATLGQEHLVAKLSTLFGVLALLLAAIGLYGVLSYRTARRTSEIGIRMALGAGRGSVVSMVLRETCLLVALGVAAGMFAAVMLAGFLRSMFFGLSSFEAGPMLAAAAIIIGASLCASLVPAWRAAHVDPTVALRTE